MKITKKSFFLILIFSMILASQFIIPKNIQEVKAESKLWGRQTGLGTTDNPIADAFGSDKPRDPKIIAANIIKVFLGFLGIIFLYLIVLAGYKYMTAQGNEEKVQEATKQITRAVIGLIIILSAYAITSYISNNVIEPTPKTEKTGFKKSTLC